MAWTKSRLKMMRISSIAIIVTLVLLLIFAGFTFYGNKVGNFVVNVNNDGAKLALSKTEDLSDVTSRLVVEGTERQTNATLSHIPDNISEGIGLKTKDETVITRTGEEVVSRYMAFSFYLLNYSDYAVNYTMALTVYDVLGDPLSCLRVLVIEGDAAKTDGTIFAQNETSEQKQQELYARQKYTTTDFFSDTQLIYREFKDFRPNTKVKYTFVFWLEGWDESCTDARMDDRMKLSLEFNAY